MKGNVVTELKPVKFGLVGIGGYGASYVTNILALEKEGLGTFGAAVVRSRGKYPEQEKALAERGVPIVGTMEEMLALGKSQFDVVAIPTGIEWHRDQVIRAAEAGFNIICEKPTTATIQDFDAMSAALQRAGTWCQIGFQSQSAPAVRNLKSEICSGRLGRVKEVIVTCCWMRDNHYYARNSWAGKLTCNGRWVLDGTINNPQAHYLFNGLYFASNEPGQAALPKSVRAELYHAHEIESEDTACLEALCQNGAKVYFYGTVAASANAHSVIEVFGERGRAVWDSTQTLRFYEGERLVSEVPPPALDGSVEQWRNVARRYRGEDKELNCPLEMTRAHVLAVNGAFLSSAVTRQISADGLEITELAEPKPHIRTVITGIEKIAARAAAGRKLYSDLGVPWAARTQAVDVSRLTTFDFPR